ncbi:accessory Sec system glycosylation chaperone GtfB [Leuconostoc gasicomitatum]|uniref:accessory Sec system glycosylation chaperone GtfB n=1 Tax=Leuconostoc gasicomitatum TaxID=115778 RepID=UPI001CC66F06|nr:accessory Sec system glycosylation chaperone GtfB [Leuconostoc gasicomitatum]MBZ5988000.1 accessory Sec system glycosylation chaperone GtfB [Leuconostoc gasicomitatum]MBZ5990036.1 accessory Sec system glycosylation chaperone GtfB [Leuconostoc gasicomitatum]
MINLFDRYTQSSRDLHDSLKAAGYDQATVVVTEDGFLPDHVSSPFSYYTKIYEQVGRPLYFNQVDCPNFWEIRGNNHDATIYDEDKKMANIIYVPNLAHKRYVQKVEWLDLNGHIRSVDHYSKNGNKFAHTNYNIMNQPTITTYYSVDNHEIIVENHITKDIILNLNQQVYIFKSRADFVTYYLKSVYGNDMNRILYNSLSVPFLVSYQLEQPGDDLLFWQEPLAQDMILPGNMINLLEHHGRTQKIIFQNKIDYNKVQNKYPHLAHQLSYVGYIYPINKHDQDPNEALILTNSDDIEQITQIVEALPSVNFNIGALTEMSSKLMRLMKYQNVTLYPNIEYDVIDELLTTCAFYLDINHDMEIMSAVRRAFLNNLLILTFDNTSHNQEFTLPEHIFTTNNSSELVSSVLKYMSNRQMLLDALILQQNHANQSSIDDYQNIIN